MAKERKHFGPNIKLIRGGKVYIDFNCLQKKIKIYCLQKDISINQFMTIAGINPFTLYLTKRKQAINVKTLNKIIKYINIDDCLRYSPEPKQKDIKEELEKIKKEKGIE